MFRVVNSPIAFVAHTAGMASVKYVLITLPHTLCYLVSAMETASTAAEYDNSIFNVEAVNLDDRRSAGRSSMTSNHVDSNALHSSVFWLPRNLVSVPRGQHARWSQVVGGSVEKNSTPHGLV